jgi:hypothetical protein
VEAPTVWVSTAELSKIIVRILDILCLKPEKSKFLDTLKFSSENRKRKETYNFKKRENL